ncbi:hypothetical protein DFH27DRAFT_21800 [Peziza echinospora]|nr:hypothetical protein DFH27DRAFT_21800 [Peziza echinospora]
MTPGSNLSPTSPQTTSGTFDPRPRPYEDFRKAMTARQLAPSQAAHFLTTTLTLLNSSTSDITQKIIRDLASENGLRHISRFAEAQYTLEPSGLQSMDFWTHCVPFLKLITHEEIRSSLVLERFVGTIYNVLYGHSGVRAIPFFKMVAQHLSGYLSPSNLHKDMKLEDFGSALCAAAAAFYMTLNINQSAPLQEEFTTVAASLRECHKLTGHSYTGRAADNEIRKVEQKLHIAESIPFMETIKAEITPYKYEKEYDLPGESSVYGPRHDNDKANIGEIDVLPTKDEILASSGRTEYIPLKDYDPLAHHLPPGLNRVLDTQFRLLREDTSGQLRDAVHFLLQSLARNPNQVPRKHGGTQTIIYKNVWLEEFKPADRDLDGLQIDISFDQPQHIIGLNVRSRSPADAFNSRKQWWEFCRYLQAGSLICLVDPQNNFTFFTVAEREVERVHKNTTGEYEATRPNRTLAEDPDRAFVTLKIVDPLCLNKVIREYHRQCALDDKDIALLPYLVEFPGLLFPSFEPILKFLQSITSDGTSRVPFSKLIAPEGNTGTANSHPEADDSPGAAGYIQVDPPLYLAKENVSLDLSCIAKNPIEGGLTHSINNPCSVEDLLKNTTLDKGQAEALIGGLTKELVLIQGPPGTGKSYVGLQIVRVLLSNAAKFKLGPIVCVTFTNHALDQFLLELLAMGPKKPRLIRLGSRSKAPELQDLRLRNVVLSFDSTPVERDHTRELRDKLSELKAELSVLCEGLSKELTWWKLKIFLEEEYPHFHGQIFGGRGKGSDGFTLVTHQKEEHLIDNWCRLKHLSPDWKNIDPNFFHHQRSVEDLLAEGDLRLPNSQERWNIIEHWKEQIQHTHITQLSQNMIEFNRIKKQLDNGERERRCLQSAQVIGVTTTGLAGHAELLRNLNAKVMICEEAGEVLEAHTLTALLPSVEHAILIGDHQQLRPHIANYSLSMESREGKQYALDESLFERLTRERYGVNKELRFPFSTLDTQRRMHPSIANLVRQTLYPKLQDFPNTHVYPGIDGMKKRLYWLNHNHLEAGGDKSDPQQMSKSNDYEVEMASALVKHLIKQGCNGKGDIAVITPYLGQLKKLRQRLSTMVEILVGEKDEEALDLVGDDLPIQLQNVQTLAKLPSEQARKGQILNEVRVSTVDNFQGEEAKIIIVSLVRCNEAQKVGFLKTSNRVNVLLSRAKHGMYIIGSADTARCIPMWSDVLSMLAKDDNLGDSLPLSCPRHPELEISVTEPDDFLRFSPEGGCDLRCGKRLSDCGHTCASKCHSEMLHNAMVCMEECTRGLVGCSHPCVTVCGKPCAKCMVRQAELQLPCGHTAQNVPCHEAQNPSSIRCRRMKLKTVPGCAHEVNVECHVDVAGDNYRCPIVCGKSLLCGHQCVARCYECTSIRSKTTEDGVAKSEHVKCRTKCGRGLSACQHVCSKACHGTEECGLCEKPCEIRCNHSQCTKKCHEPCTPCSEGCTWGCEHQGKCEMPCAIPCDILPCSERCSNQLECGHRCPSICGEKCPTSKYCQECAGPEIRDSIVDFVSMESYHDVNLDEDPVIILSCGHFFCMGTMDGLMQMRDVYEMNVEGKIIHQKDQGDWISKINYAQTRCPTCRAGLRDINRYNRVAKGLLIDLSTKKFTESSHRRFLDLEKMADEEESRLEKTSVNMSTAFPDQIRRASRDREKIKIDPTQYAINIRHGTISKVEKDILEFIRSVTAEEQPYGRIRRLAQDSIRRQRSNDIGQVTEDMSVQLRMGILARSLLMRARWMHLHDLRQMYEVQSIKITDKRFLKEIISSPLSDFKEFCKKLEVDAKNALQWRQVVEAMIFHARLVALEFKVISPPKSKKTLIRPQQPPVAGAVQGEGAILPPIFEQTPEEKWEIEKIRKRDEEVRNLDQALRVCQLRPGSTRGLESVIEETKQTLKKMGGVFFSPVTTDEQRAIYNAMRAEFRGTGHWYYCVNRHLVSISFHGYVCYIRHIMSIY